MNEFPLDRQQSIELARRLRKHVLRMTGAARSAHVGSAFSMIDMLSALYGRFLQVNPAEPQWPGRDRFILSKGHACAALYAVLAECGFFPLTWLDDFYLDGARLPGHVTRSTIPGVEVSTGSLGHGLSMACGMALVGKRDETSYRIFALLGDGECDEGSTWEAVLFAAHHGLDNLVAIVDYNKIQSMGTVKEVLNLDPFAAKWESFGWAVHEIDGHNWEQIEHAFSRLPLVAGKPTCVLAHTVKGKGVSFMENKLLWHYRSAVGEEYDLALAELEADR
jgi:transketolase